MVDVTKATNLLMSLGVAPSVASRAAERMGKDGAAQTAQSFLQELQDALGAVSAATTTASTKPAMMAAETTTANTKAPAVAPAPAPVASPAPAPAAAAKAPFVSFEQFKHWEANLGNKFSPQYQVPDYVRAMGLSLNGGEETAFKRYTFFKDNPQFAVDYEGIRKGGLSKFPTDGSTLVKSDLSAMPTRIADQYKNNVGALLMAEGFNMDPTLYRMRMEGTIDVPKDVDATAWLTNNRWTAQGPQAQDNRAFYASADYIGLDGKGAGTYKLPKFDPATGYLVDANGQSYDSVTGTRIT